MLRRSLSRVQIASSASVSPTSISDPGSTSRSNRIGSSSNTESGRAPQQHQQVSKMPPPTYPTAHSYPYHYSPYQGSVNQYSPPIIPQHPFIYPTVASQTQPPTFTGTGLPPAQNGMQNEPQRQTEIPSPDSVGSNTQRTNTDTETSVKFRLPSLETVAHTSTRSQWFRRRFRPLVIVPEGVAIVVERFGIYTATRDRPGWWPLVPFVDTVSHAYLTGWVPERFPMLECATADGKKVRLTGCWCQVRVVDARAAAYHAAGGAEKQWRDLVESVVGQEVSDRVIVESESGECTLVRVSTVEEQRRRQNLKNGAAPTEVSAKEAEGVLGNVPSSHKENNPELPSKPEATPEGFADAVNFRLRYALQGWGLEHREFCVGGLVASPIVFSRPNVPQNDCKAQQTELADVKKQRESEEAEVKQKKLKEWEMTKAEMVHRAQAEAECLNILCETWRKNKDVASDVMRCWGKP